MTNDRLITISAGAGRQAKTWTPQQLYISDLYERLRVPARGRETLEQYMALSKADRDSLKDVGGFVGGEIAGRRKPENVRSRDVLTLDMDSIAAGGTRSMLQRVEALGCGYCVYSTRKHSPAAPRLRIIIPTDRAMTPDEYEPIARKLAEYIGIDMADPSTFEVSRLMYWPSCSADSEYVYAAADKPLLSADGMLAAYEDWRDVSQWPQVPGTEKNPARLASRQGDPTEKSGAIGAFCRTYDIYGAAEAFLPGMYEALPGFEDRLTYTQGSTVGGALVYDDGKFLFSHHATDPCSGKLVNAFDLVRLHKFGYMDDEATPGTFTNQLPSFRAMTDLCKQDPATAQLMRRENGERILEAFGKTDAPAAPDENALAMYLGGLTNEVMTTDMVRTLTELTGIKMRLNEITWHAELSGYPKKWSRANAENLLPVMLKDRLKVARVKGSEKNAISDCLDIVAEEGRYNPVADMLRSEAWDGQDRTEALCDIWGVRDVFSRRLVRKWLLQCVAMGVNDEDDPKGADGVLVLQGPQGVGKTSALRELVPVPRMFKEGAKLDLRDKDTYIQALSSWICELGELDRTTVRDSAGLKAFLTQDMDEYRTPYAKKAVRRPRRTSFCGTVNPEDYLVDDTGNRRFWTVSVVEMDLPRLFGLTREWKVQLWAQLYAEYLADRNGFRLTREEREQLERINGEHTRKLDFEEELRDMLNFELPIERWGEFTSAQVAARLEAKPLARVLGRVLNKLREEDTRIIRKVIHGQRLYRLPMLSSCVISQFQDTQRKQN